MSSGTTISFHRADGSAVVLSNGYGDGDGRLLLLHGSMGLGIGPQTFASAPILGGHGSILRGKRTDERDIFVPILLDADTVDEANTIREELRQFFSPFDDSELVVRVSVAGRDGYREIPVHYKDGLAGNFDGLYRGDWQVLGLELRAFDAVWRGVRTGFEQKTATVAKKWLQAEGDTVTKFFPASVASAAIQGRIDAFVAGDAPTYGVWTITPPGENLTITHVNSGKTFAITGTLTEQVVIDMETGRITTATMPNNEMYDRVALGSQPFPLYPGSNTLDFNMTAATATSAVKVEYTPRYLGGH